MRWERGDITFLFNGESKPRQSLSVLDNKAEVFQRVRYEVFTFNILSLSKKAQIESLRFFEYG